MPHEILHILEKFNKLQAIMNQLENYNIQGFQIINGLPNKDNELFEAIKPFLTKDQMVELKADILKRKFKAKSKVETVSTQTDFEDMTRHYKVLLERREKEYEFIKNRYYIIKENDAEMYAKIKQLESQVKEMFRLVEEKEDEKTRSIA